MRAAPKLLKLNSIKVNGKRKGVSPVVAELCTIAVVLIASVLLSSILYGAFSIYTNPAEVAVQEALCSASGSSETCQFILSNFGSGMVHTDSQCVMNLKGSPETGIVQNGGNVPAGGTLSGVACVVTGTIVGVGSHIVGDLALTNGALVYFAATTN